MRLFKKFFKKNGFVDKVKDRRLGLIFIKQESYSYYIISRTGPNPQNYNMILEVKEIFNDKIYSKVDIVNIPFNSSDKEIKNFNPWIDSSKIHWLSPSKPVDRDNKLSEILK